MRDRNKLSTMTMIVSLVFFLFASAFTYAPTSANSSVDLESMSVELVNDGNVELMGGCYTCTFNSQGAPNGCKSASFCGMTICEGDCDMTGDLCGECACEDPTVPCEA